MREGIHPKYGPVVITCMGCGTKIETRSTKGRDFSIDVCSKCHPFFTGRQKFVDSAGRIERFQKKWAGSAAAREALAAKSAKAQPAAPAATPADQVAAPAKPEAAAATPAKPEAAAATPAKPETPAATSVKHETPAATSAKPEGSAPPPSAESKQ